MNQAALKDALVRGRAFLEERFVEPERPRVAVEVRSGSVGVVRVLGEGASVALGAAALVELPPGTVVLSMSEPNVKDVPAFTRGARSVVAKVTKRASIARVSVSPARRYSPLSSSASNLACVFALAAST